MKNSQQEDVHTGRLFHYNIILIGFMGTGKSTISEYLGEKYAMDIIEMDQEIVKRENMSISDIFEKYGEEYFRNLETQLLIEMQSRTHTIVSCGGGVAMREENVAEMKKNGRVVLLTATPTTILERIKDNNERPLLEGNKNLAFIEELMAKRREKYEKAADVVIYTDEKTVSEIGEELISKLRKMEG